MKQPTTYLRRLRYMLPLGIGIFLCQLSCAQQAVTSSKRPPDPVEYTWWLDPEAGILRSYEGGRWKREFDWCEPKYMRSATLSSVGDLVALVLPEGSISLVDLQGNPVIDRSVKSLELYDSLVMTHTDYGDILVDARHGTIRDKRILNFHLNVTTTPVVQQLGDMTVFSIAEYIHLPPTRMVLEEVRNWGVITERGEWLVPPKYDGPIVFRDGVAEVSCMGRRFRINEKGEEVQ